jgi:hypothetical protein
MWVLWRERNARSFEDIEHSTQEIKQFSLAVLLEWTNASGLFHFTSIFELINSCQLSLIGTFCIRFVYMGGFLFNEIINYQKKEFA